MSAADPHARGVALAPKVSLVGQMGAGKSSVAARLAELWQGAGYRAVDLDREIEIEAGRSVAALFREAGEAYFRGLEASVLRALLGRPEPLIIATGGGAPCQQGAMAQLKAAGWVVWLEASPETLARRALDPSRPLLAGMDLAAAEHFLKTQLTTRRPFYAQADVVVDASLPLDAVVAAIAGRVVPSNLLDPTR
jgi:shikimate kinase